MSIGTLKRLLLPAEVLEVLPISRPKLRRLIEDGEIVAVDISPAGSRRPRYAVEPRELEAFLKRRRRGVQYQVGQAKGPRRRRRSTEVEEFFQ